MTRLSRRDLLRLGGTAALLAAAGGCATASAATATRWQAIPSYSLQGTDPKRVAYLRAQLDAFTAAGGQIAPEVTSADTVAAMTKLLLQASQGRAPDVAQVDSYLFGRMSRFAQPLDDAMARHGLVLDDWFPGVRPVMTGGAGTSVRGLQFTTDVRVLYYRKDLVPRPPVTWDELLSMMKPLARQGYSFLFPGGRSEGAVLTTLWTQIWAQGAEIIAPDGAPAFTGGAGYAAARTALGSVEQAVRSGVTPPAVATYGAEDKANSDVVAGRVAMFMGGSWQAAALNSAIKSKDFFTTWGVATLPTPAQQQATAAGGWVWAAFTADPAKVRTGIDWVTKAYVDDAGMAAWCTAGGYLPPRQSIYDRPEYKQNPFTPFYRNELAQHARTRPAAPKYLEVSATMQIALSSVASGATTAGQALDAALARLV